MSDQKNEGSEQPTEQQTKSHSELFGLDPTNNSEHKGHPAPGGPIAGTIDPTKGKDDGPKPAGSSGNDEKDTKVGGVDSEGDGGSERPGAGGSTLKPEQGSNKAADNS